MSNEKDGLTAYEREDLRLRTEHNALLRRQVELTEKERETKRAIEAQTAARLEANDVQNRMEAEERGALTLVEGASLMVDLGEEYGGACRIGVRLTLQKLTAAKRAADKRFKRCVEGHSMVWNTEAVDVVEASSRILEGLTARVQPSIDSALREDRRDIVEQIRQSLHMVQIAPGELGLRGHLRRLVWSPIVKRTVGKCFADLVRDGVVQLAADKALLAAEPP